MQKLAFTVFQPRTKNIHRESPDPKFGSKYNRWFYVQQKYSYWKETSDKKKKKIIESVPRRLIHIKPSLEMKSLHTPSQEMTSTASACAAVEDLGLGGWWQCQDSLQWWICKGEVTLN